MAKYRKKPGVIEAVQYTGDSAELPSEFRSAIARSIKGGSCFIDTLEGTHECRPGDWILRGVRNEFYPCKPEIFDETYELVS